MCDGAKTGRRCSARAKVRDRLTPLPWSAGKNGGFFSPRANRGTTTLISMETQQLKNMENPPKPTKSVWGAGRGVTVRSVATTTAAATLLVVVIAVSVEAVRRRRLRSAAESEGTMARRAAYAARRRAAVGGVSCNESDESDEYGFDGIDGSGGE